jgi:hypothetical protein
MNEATNQLAQAFGELNAMLADVPDSAPVNWVAHCLTRLFFWRAVSLRWQVATGPQRNQLNTVLCLSDATLYDAVLPAAAAQDTPPGAALETAHAIAHTLAALCQAQTDPALWHATLQPEQFRPGTPDAASVLLRLYQGMNTLWPAGNTVSAPDVFTCMVLLLQREWPTTPPAMADFLLAMLQPQANEIIFDPCCGSGRLLRACAERLQHNGGQPESRQALLIGQDSEPEAVALARLHLVLHGWGYQRVETRPDPLQIGLKLENGKPLFADVVMAILPQQAEIDLAWHALQSLNTERGRMALLLDPALLASDHGQSLLRFLIEQRILQAVIEMPNGCLSKRQHAPSCLMISYRQPLHSVAFISHRFNTRHALNRQSGLDLLEIRQAWQAYLAGMAHPNYLLIDSALVQQHEARLDAMPFGRIWDAMWLQCERIAQQEQVLSSGTAQVAGTAPTTTAITTPGKLSKRYKN